MTPPHVPRLLERLRRLEGPLILLWGWPGTGKRALLEALAQEEAAVWVAAGDLAAGEELAEGARWLLCRGEPDEDLLEPASLAARLRPPQRLVVAGRRRGGRAGAAEVVGPGELRLTGDEVDALLGRRGRASPSHLAAATDGWLEPLRRLAAAGLPEEPTAELLASRREVSAFLRQQVFEPLSPELRELLLEVSAGEDLEADLWRQVWGEGDERLACLGRLLAEEGLWVEEGGRRRLPRLLAAWLLAERRRCWPPGRRLAAAQRLALAAYGLGRLERAVAVLAAAEDAPRLGRLLEAEWLEVFAAVPAPVVAAALAVAPPEPGGGRELLAAVLDRLAAAAGGEAAAAERLLQLSRREASDPRLSAVAALAAAVVPAAGEPPGATPARLRRQLGGAAAPEAVRTLLRWLEGGSALPSEMPAAPLASSLARCLLAEGRRLRPAPHSRAAVRATGEAPPRPRYHLFLLGAPEVIQEGPGGRREVRWTLRRAFKILAYLASSPGLAAARDALVEAAWPEAREEEVERNFHPTLSHLRKNLAGGRKKGPPALLFARGIYRLNPEIDWWIDVVELHRRFAEGRSRLAAGDREGATEAWREAWSLYRGPFLEGHYDPWVAERREGLARVYLEGLRQLGDLLFADGDTVGALDAYRSVLAADPLQEQVHLAVMRIYARQGRRDLVRRQYDRLSGLLQEELGVEPLAETTEEFHRLMG